MSSHCQLEKNKKNGQQRKTAERGRAGCEPQQHTVQRAVVDPAGLTADDMLQLQRTVGNRALSGVLSGLTTGDVQAKLTVNTPGDYYEREADRIAASVARRSNQNHENNTVDDMDEAGKGIRVRTLSGAVSGKAAGSVGAPEGLEASLQRARSGDHNLPDGVRANMEQSFGSDFGGVRVHNDTASDRLSRSLNARAFTSGQDVFFRRGEYRPGSRAGQELLAHELTHVVQQSGGMLQRKRNPGVQPPVSRLSGPADSALTLQFKPAYVNGNAHLRAFQGEGTEKSPYIVSERKRIGPKLVQNDQLEVDDRKKDKSGKWIWAEFNGKKGFIRADKVRFDFGKTRLGELGEKVRSTDLTALQRPEEENEGEKLETTGQIAENISGGISDELDALRKNKMIAENSRSGKVWSDVGDWAGITGGLLGLAGMVSAVKKTRRAEDKTEKAEGALEVVGNISKTGEGVTGLANTFKKGKGLQTSNSILGSVSIFIDAVKDAFGIFKEGYDLWKKGHSQDGLSKSEKAKGGMNIAEKGISIAKGAVEGMKKAMSTVDKGKKLASAIPGLGIALSAVKIAIKGCDVMTASKNIKKMKEIRQGFKQKQTDKKYVQDVKKIGVGFGFKGGRLPKFYRKEKTSARVDQEKLKERKQKLTDRVNNNTVTQDRLDDMLAEEKEKRDTPERCRPALKEAVGKLTGEDVGLLLKETSISELRRKLAEKIKESQAKRGGARGKITKVQLNKKISEEVERRSISFNKLQVSLQPAVGVLTEAQVKKLWQKKNGTLEIKDAIEAKIKSTQDKLSSGAYQEELLDIEQYESATYMKDINKKRVTRGEIQIGAEITKIAGEIATLTGAGAVSGVPLKFGASGFLMGMSFFRGAKQYGRDLAEKTGNKTLGKVFNTDKSSTRKQEERLRQARLIFDVVAALPEVNSKEDYDNHKEQYERVESLIKATGCSPERLYELNGDVDKQYELLVKSMKERE